MAVERETSTIIALMARYSERYERGRELDGRINALVRQHMDGTKERLETALAQYLKAAKSGSVHDERNAWDRLVLLRRMWQEEMETAGRVAYDVVMERRP